MTATAHRGADSLLEGGRPGFGRLLLSEWTKLRTVRRWAIALLAAPVLVILVGLVTAASSQPGAVDAPVAGPDGVWVQDRFHFVHRPLSGDGTVTTRVVSTSLEVSLPPEDDGDVRATDIERRVWSKAGLMIKDGLRPGSPYAAVMLTPGHGVRLQSNFTTDIAGPAAAAPTWLRLTRAGSTISAFQSADGISWTPVGTVTVADLPQTVEVGPFVASPTVALLAQRQLGSIRVGQYPTTTRALFERPTLQPTGTPGTGPGEPRDGWQDDEIDDSARQPGAPPTPDRSGDKRSPSPPPAAVWVGDRLTLIGVGDIAPRTPGEDVIKQNLTGVYAGLMAIVAVAVLFVTTEYRRGMLRTTFAASPGRRRVLAAKALVIGVVTFVLGLVATVAALLITRPIMRDNGYLPPVYPDWSLTDPPVLRAVVGTAAVLAAIAVFSLALGTVLRRAASAVTIVIVLIVLPQLLASGLPPAAGQWLMRLTPAAGFTIQQTIPTYEHVPRICAPENGCVYDQPWAGFGVICAYAVVTMAVALWLLRRRDA
ncbi:ABC-2 family transporter [Micromonospora violae]|uniref:ABC-2 family transporter n=1 Tax=Micromonospora violae TaxID=1278207 RepID=A0A4Q7UGZ4_9ACTN|nr:ABC transporter permease subunit [Micromonospora violae]RZT79511.1 ABC-2 family transporter [Micromonospora violae]